MASATPGVPQVPLMHDDALGFGDEESLGKYNHPYVVFFHLLFRCSALVVYILCGWFSDSFIASFVFVTLLLSADFWTVKNISGRLLVGLRWWNYVDDDGKSNWVYESKKDYSQGQVNPNESRIFWLGLIICPLFWSIFFVIALFGFKLKWLLLVMIALTLSGANLFGYIKCKFGAKENLKSVTTNFVKQQFFQNAASFIRPAQPPTSQPTGIV